MFPFDKMFLTVVDSKQMQLGFIAVGITMCSYPLLVVATDTPGQVVPFIFGLAAGLYFGIAFSLKKFVVKNMQEDKK
jgi:hypothetical protein